MISALEYVYRMASGMRMHIVTSSSFDHRGIEVGAYLPGDKRLSMWGGSTHSYELAARRMLKKYRPDVYDEIKPHLFPLSHRERSHA